MWTPGTSEPCDRLVNEQGESLFWAPVDQAGSVSAMKAHLPHVGRSHNCEQARMSRVSPCGVFQRFFVHEPCWVGSVKEHEASSTIWVTLEYAPRLRIKCYR
jgi:hypothetical protein